MPMLPTTEAVEKLAAAIATVPPGALREIQAECFHGYPQTAPPSVADIARHIRSGLQAEEIVDLWNLVFPVDRDVYYNEETKAVHYNEELAHSTD